jgi:thiol-disulfide isomerase/thioredoxin
MCVAAVLLICIGFFIGYVSFVPIQRSRIKEQTEQRQESEKDRIAEFVNKPAPAVVSETLDGEPWILADHSDKIVVVFFWSILCGSCVETVPAMDSLSEKYAKNKDFVVVGVHRYPEREIIACYISTKEIEWLQLYEQGDSSETGFFNSMNVKRTPAICIIDRGGTVQGFFTDAQEAVNKLQYML